MERDQSKSSTTKKPKVNGTSKSKKPKTSKVPTSIQDQLSEIEATRIPKNVTPTMSIEEVLKQYKLDGLDIATTPKSSAYGTSNDAILASILKEQGIAPPTPKSLEVLLVVFIAVITIFCLLFFRFFLLISIFANLLILPIESIS